MMFEFAIRAAAHSKWWVKQEQQENVINFDRLSTIVQQASQKKGRHDSFEHFDWIENCMAYTTTLNGYTQ